MRGCLQGGYRRSGAAPSRPISRKALPIVRSRRRVDPSSRGRTDPDPDGRTQTRTDGPGPPAFSVKTRVVHVTDGGTGSTRAAHTQLGVRRRTTDSSSSRTAMDGSARAATAEDEPSSSRLASLTWEDSFEQVRRRRRAARAGSGNQNL
ncbi:unnamed protein product [Merluccius merluccius]